MGPVNSMWTVPFVPYTVLTCDVTVHEQCLCPLHSAHMWCYCSRTRRKKKQKKKKTVYTNVGLETQIQPALKYGSGKWDHGS